jgi:hypothetical protein
MPLRNTDVVAFAKEAAQSFANGNHSYVLKEIHKQCTKKQAIAVAAYVVHYLPVQDVEYFLRFAETFAE